MANPRILVADDHDEMRQRIATLLESAFDVVATVADGQAAVEAVRALHPDVVVLDIAMPVLNGLEAAAIIKDLPEPPKIVFATGYDDPEFAEASVALGASGFVLKRNMSEIVSVIHRALNVHAVCFYENAQSLARTVGSFIGTGLAINQPAVLIATRAHGDAIVEQMSAMALDPRKRMEQGELVMLCADELLSRFMVDGMPDAVRFQDTLGPIMDAAAGSGNRVVRAYGEMVDLLWNNDKAAAAVSLEILWNQLIARRKLSLLCGYRLEGIGSGDESKKICDLHSHVVAVATTPAQL
jgi:CheY-like chemotaxis protein